MSYDNAFDKQRARSELGQKLEAQAKRGRNMLRHVKIGAEVAVACGVELLIEAHTNIVNISTPVAIIGGSALALAAIEGTRYLIDMEVNQAQYRLDQQSSLHPGAGMFGTGSSGHR